MEELVKRVSEQAGISEEQGVFGVNTVAEYLKEEGPGPVHGLYR